MLSLPSSTLRWGDENPRFASIGEERKKTKREGKEKVEGELETKHRVFPTRLWSLDPLPCFFQVVVPSSLVRFSVPSSCVPNIVVASNICDILTYEILLCSLEKRLFYPTLDNSERRFGWLGPVIFLLMLRAFRHKNWSLCWYLLLHFRAESTYDLWCCLHPWLVVGSGWTKYLHICLMPMFPCLVERRSLGLYMSSAEVIHWFNCVFFL